MTSTAARGSPLVAASLSKSAIVLHLRYASADPVVVSNPVVPDVTPQQNHEVSQSLSKSIHQAHPLQSDPQNRSHHLLLTNNSITIIRPSFKQASATMNKQSLPSLLQSLAIYLSALSSDSPSTIGKPHMPRPPLPNLTFLKMSTQTFHSAELCDVAWCRGQLSCGHGLEAQQAVIFVAESLFLLSLCPYRSSEKIQSFENGGTIWLNLL